MAVTHFIRSLGVPCSLYIDDRHVGQLRLPQDRSPIGFSNSQLADMAAFIACSTLISLGYFIGLKKSSLQPATAVRFLGYICDSQRQAFTLPHNKRSKFSALREAILRCKTVSLKNLQNFAGKTTSFALLVPAAKLYTNQVFQAISKACKSHNPKILLSGSLRRKISHWRFLDTWTDACCLTASLPLTHAATGTWGSVNSQLPRRRLRPSSMPCKTSPRTSMTPASTYSSIAKSSWQAGRSRSPNRLASRPPSKTFFNSALPRISVCPWLTYRPTPTPRTPPLGPWQT